MRKHYTLPEELGTFFEVKTQCMNQNALIVSLITKWLFSNVDVAKEYDAYIQAIKEDQKERMKLNHWKNKGEYKLHK